MQVGLQEKNKGRKRGTLVAITLRRRCFPVNQATKPLANPTLHPYQVNRDQRQMLPIFMAPTTPCSQENGKWLFCQAICKAQADFRSTCFGNISNRAEVKSWG